MNIKASIITIGDELLIGQVIDTNSAWIAQRLNELGIEVIRRVAVGDDEAAMRNALDDEISRASIIIITGGLGPTSDDITKPFLCKYFDSKPVLDEKILAHIKEMFAKRSRPFTENNIKQAEVPDKCKPLFNKIGTAPGMWFEKEGKVIISLPGVPYEMKGMMEDEALPRIRKIFISDSIMHKTIITAGQGESFIAEQIKDLEEALPSHIKLAYLPAAGMVRLRLTGHGNDELRLNNELKLRQEEIANRLEDIVVALEDAPLELILGKLLMEQHATLGLAESCTGGNIAHHITQVMGSTGYFNGSIVCYQNEVKEKILNVKHETLEKYGAVSEQVAIEMAAGARNILSADYTLAITGLLSGYTGESGTGLAWIAVADKTEIMTRKIVFHYDRHSNKEIATQVAMLLIWKFIKGKL